MTREEAHALADHIGETPGLRVGMIVNAVGKARDRGSDCIDLYLLIRPQEEWWCVHGTRSSCGHRFELAYAEGYSLSDYADYCPQCSHRRRD